MMAVRERAVKVMAALDRRVPSLDEFVGQSWTAWVEWADVTATDGPDIDDCSKNGKKTAEAMSLSKDDMSIFGLYPGHDDFYLVVCCHCGQVVKPQAFEKHCERRHGPLAKLYPRIRSPAQAAQPQPRSHHNHSPSNAASAPAWEGRGQGVRTPWLAPSSPTTPPQNRHAKNPKDGIRHSPLDKSSHSSHTEPLVFKQPPPQEPPISSPPPSLRDPPWPHEGTPPGRPSLTEHSPSQRKDSPLSSPVCSQRIPRHSNKVAPKRECDLDKHCGVLDPEKKKVCTRLLTCNIHSIHQRRKVVGRSKNFDQLVVELKTKVREKGAQSVYASGPGQFPCPEAHREAEAPLCRKPLASLPAFCRSSGTSERPAEEEEEEKPPQIQQDDRQTRASSPIVLGHISSDESGTEAPEEHAEFFSTSTHPRPLEVCSFGSHTLGQGIYTFDRRLHHLRSALSSMLEQHISSHLWKKIPQATDLKSHPPVRTPLSSSSMAAVNPLYSKVHTGSLSGSSLKSSQDGSPSSRGPGRPMTANQSENFWGSGASLGAIHQNSQGKPDVNCPGGPRHKKQPGRREEAVGAAAAFRKRKAPSQEAEHSGPERNCILLQDRGRPHPVSSSSPIHSLLPHGQTNGTHSPSGKPRPQPAPSEPHSPAAKGLWTYKRTHSSSQDSSTNNSHSRGVVGGDSGVHGQCTGRTSEHQGLVKKRKGAGVEEHSPSHKPPTQRPPSSSMLASSSPRPNFYPWKESKNAGLAGGAEKKMSTQKPKLHH